VADYNIRVKIDPTGADAGRDRVRQTLEGIERQAGQAGAAIDRALDFGNVRPNAAPINSALNSIKAPAAQAATAIRTVDQASAEATTKLNQAAGAATAAGGGFRILAADSIAAATRLREINATLQTLYSGQARAGQAYVASAAQQRQATVQLGAQFNDFSTQVLLGSSVTQAFAAQAGQAAFALSNMGGTLGTVGRFLAGPWGTAIIIATTILGSMAGKFFDNSKAAEEAEKAAKKFQDRQADIANFIDRTTGKLIEQNRTLIQNAILLRQARIDENSKVIKEGSQKAFEAATSLADRTSQDGFAERGLSAKSLDPAISTVIVQAGGDVEKLDIGLQRLARARPDLRKSIADINELAAKSVIAQRESKQFADEIAALEGRQKAQGVQTAAEVERRVRLSTATTAVERAQARLSDVQARGAAIDKISDPAERSKALKQYEQDLTTSTRAVKEAEEAQKGMRSAASAASREIRAQARIAEEAADFLKKLNEQADVLSRRGVEGEIAKQVDAYERIVKRGASPDEKRSIEAGVRRVQLLTDERDILNQVLGPVEAYQRQIAALNDLLARGKISQEDFNDALTNLPLAQSVSAVDKSLDGTLIAYQARLEEIDRAVQKAEKIIADAQRAGILSPDEAKARREALRGPDPQNGEIVAVGNGRDFRSRQQEQAKRSALAPLDALDNELGGAFKKRAQQKALRDEQKERMKLIRDLREQELISQQEFEERKLAIAEDANRKRRDMELAEQQVRLQAAQSIGDSLLSILENTAGRQSAVYKAMFAVTKAFAIAESIVNIQRALASATASLPFPANLPVIAQVVAEGASIIANITAVAGQFRDGGYLAGAGGPRDDANLIRASNGEFIVNAEATAKNRSVLEAINAGQNFGGGGGGGGSGAPAIAPSGGAPLNVSIYNYGGSKVRVERSDDELRVLIDDRIDKRAPKAVARDMTNRNGPVQKGLRRTTTARSETR